MSGSEEGSAHESASADPVPPSSLHDHVRAARSDFENHVAHARAEFDEANARIKQRTGRDLILAILIGIAVGAVVFVSIVSRTGRSLSSRRRSRCSACSS